MTPTLDLCFLDVAIAAIAADDEILGSGTPRLCNTTLP